ncbi:hypothetical protein KIN20_020209 [Parelaphostrongylus tenuis]|uniref:Uncharacterized protein n=1 Tax=Parelaphostrongylus tenuis TaxID=148309 RepID=A0AAD5N9K0_PARTN|nr:hypothetical protein KIN20_020209 [Parelaphostrongylus tenuis]
MEPDVPSLSTIKITDSVAHAKRWKTKSAGQVIQFNANREQFTEWNPRDVKRAARRLEWSVSRESIR